MNNNLYSAITYYSRYFFISLALVFLMVVLQHLNLFAPSQIIPPILKKPEIFDTIKTKLEQKQLTGFELKNMNLINQGNASDEYDFANGYAVLNFDSGEVLAQKNFNKRLPIASLTKIMTAVVALDLTQKDELLTISKNASDQIPTKLGLIEGQKITLEEALNGL